MNIPPAQPTAGVSRLFRVYQHGLSGEPEADEHGFVKESGDAFGFEVLRPLQAVVVVGPPWVGKTFVAEQIRTLNLLDGELFSTQLEWHTIGLALQRLGWDEWVASGAQASWIVDSLDEGELIQANVHQLILHDLRSLDESVRSRLRVIIFCRETDLPEPLLAGLASLYPDSFAAVELLPLTESGARYLLGQTTFDRVLATIKKFGLQSVASYPAPLKYIERHLNEQLTAAGIWEGVLKELLEEKSEHRAKRGFAFPGTEERFAAAKHLACVMTFAGIARVVATEQDKSGLPLGELVREQIHGLGPSHLAAQCAIQSTMFTAGRFSQKHLRERMCALALNDMALGRLKVLLTEPNGDLNRGDSGVLSLLTQFGKPELREWIIEKNGGLPLPSDRPLTLTEACHILDRLEANAEKSRWNLRLWDEPAFNQLCVPGIAEELSHRLQDHSRSAARRILTIAGRHQDRGTACR